MSAELWCPPLLLILWCHLLLSWCSLLPLVGAVKFLDIGYYVTFFFSKILQLKTGINMLASTFFCLKAISRLIFERNWGALHKYYFSEPVDAFGFSKSIKVMSLILLSKKWVKTTQPDEKSPTPIIVIQKEFWEKYIHPKRTVSEIH